MAKYWVEHWVWEDGRGWQINPTIDNIDELPTEDELRDGYAGYYTAGDEIRVYGYDGRGAKKLYAKYIAPSDYKAAD